MTRSTKARRQRRKPTPAVRPKVVPESERIRGLFYPVDMTPEAFFTELGKVRKDAAAEVERLIAFLDNTDGCPDLEENGDRDADLSEHEPSLGSVDNATNQEKWAPPGDYTEHYIDREGDEHDGREPDDEPEDGGDNEPTMGCGQEDGELEPSLGSFDRMLNQSKSWQQGGDGGFYLDAEVDICDREDNGDREPEDSGIGDSGGLAEQIGGAL